LPTEIQTKWLDRINSAKKLKGEWTDRFKVPMLRAYFAGEQNPGYPAEEWITVNKIYSHLMAQLPMLYSMDPYFYVKLKKSYSVDPNEIAQWEAKGKKRAAMLNYYKSELKLKEHARLGIQDAHFAFGVIKTRRASDSEEHPHAGEPIKGENDKPLIDEATGEVMVYPDEKPVNERYEVDRIHPDDILFLEGSGPLEKSWTGIAQYLCMTKEEALDDNRFNKKLIRQMKGRSKDSGAKDTGAGLVYSVMSMVRGKKDDEVYLDFYEIYDLKKREWLIIADGAEDLVMKAKPCPPGVDKHPYSFLRFTLLDNSPYPIPPVFPMLDPQKEYNLARSRLMTHRKRFNRKYEIDVNKLENADVELDKLESGEDGTMIRVIAPGAVTPIQDAPLDQQSYTEIGLLNNDMTELSGTPDNARSIASSDSATEASLLDKRLEVREGDRMSMVVDWITEAAKKLDQLFQAHIDRDEAVKVLGIQGETWEMIKQSDYQEINGEYEYSVNTGASQPRLPDIERSQWITFLKEVVIPFPHILTAPNFMKRMAEMFHIEDEAALEEMRQMGLKILSGMMPMPGGGGGQGGGDGSNPVAKIIGAAMGPMGGNANGGGAPTVQ
jgi:hypothetical protein